MDAGKAYWMASLAEAAYVDLDRARRSNGTYDDRTIEETLSTKGYSYERSSTLVSDWQIAHHQPNTPSGFSATVFQSKTEPGAFVIAFRGTDTPYTPSGVVDLSTDFGDIGADGIALSQGIDLVNYYQRLITPVGNLAPQFGLLDGLVVNLALENGQGEGLGILSGGVSSLDVTGHSLGGHLALMFSRLDPAGVRDVYTFNAPGFGTGLLPGFDQIEWFYRAVAQVQRAATGHSGVGDFPLDRIHNFATPDDLVARVGVLPGGTLPVIGEINRATLFQKLVSAHSIGNTADALAVAALYTRLDPHATAETLAEIFESSATDSQRTLESALAKLGALFKREYGTETVDRTQLHRDVTDLFKALPETGQFRLEALASHDVGMLIQAAEADVAYRYALVNLTPFALTGDAAIYSDHPGLALFDPATGEGDLTPNGLRDRAEMLTRSMTRNLIDGSLKGPVRKEYRDAASGLVFHVDATNALPAEQIVFGGPADESLRGLDGDDRLYGGDGDDLLAGGAGQDYLEGGRGFDTYLFDAGGGLDTLLDIDGTGVIRFGDLSAQGAGGVAPADWQALADGHFRDRGRGISYLQITFGEETQLLVSQGDVGVRVRNWREGDLGITLGSPGAGIAPRDQSRGTESADYLRAGTPGPVALLGDAGRDLLWGSPDGDHLDGGDGADWLIGGAGADTILGGDGDDLVTWLGEGSMVDAGAGNDVVNGYAREWFSIQDPHPAIPATVFWADISAHWQNTRSGLIERDGMLTAVAGGGVAADTVVTGESLLGDGWSYRFSFREEGDADARYFHPTLFPEGLTPAGIWAHGVAANPAHTGPLNLSGGEGDDWLAGNAGPDHIDGGQGADLLLGNEGEDRLFGGEGDDEVAGGTGDDWLLGGPGSDRLWGEAGADLLEGGSGDDWLVGGAGGDRLRGEEGNDLLLGGSGADHLLGGTGDDVLYGDSYPGDLAAVAPGGGDHLDGGAGRDLLYGSAGGDVLLGGEGEDFLSGGPGDDLLSGGQGHDRLEGGPGADTFILSAHSDADIVIDATAEDMLSLPDTLLEQVETEFVRALDGEAYLRLQWNEEDAVFVRSGLMGGPGRYVLAHDRILSRGELIAATMSQDLQYTMVQPGTLHAGAGDDVLAGSSGDDTLVGNRGDDVLAGSAGNDLLIGGEGFDSYRVGPATGWDVIEEAGGEASVLQLLPGLGVGDLRFAMHGDDLRVETPGGRDGVEIRGFAVRDQIWSVEDAAGGQRLLSSGDLIPTHTPWTLGVFEDVKAHFAMAFETAYTNALRLEGYRRDDAGEWFRERAQAGVVRRDVVSVDRHQVVEAGSAYTRTMHTVEVSVAAQGSSTQTGVTPVYPSDSMRVAAPPGAATVDLDRLGLAGSGGIRIDGRVVPIHGAESVYNPLTGEAEPAVEGYLVLPYDAPEPHTVGFERQFVYRDHVASLNLLEVQLAGGDAVFRNQAGHEHVGSIVNGGAGNDRLDARSGDYGGFILGYYGYSAPPELRLVGSGYRPLGAFPGNLLWGGSGDDSLYGGTAADILAGGSGDDYMEGGLGGDTYIVHSGDGMDLLFEDGWHDRAGGFDTLVLPAGARRDALEFEWRETLHSSLPMDGSWHARLETVHRSLVLKWGEDDGIEIILPHSDQRAGLGIEKVIFADGNEVFFEELIEQAGGVGDVDPHRRDNVIVGARFAHGGAGDDRLQAALPGGSDLLGEKIIGYETILIGGEGRDTLLGSAGSDLLLGGSVVEDWTMEYLRPVTDLWDDGNLFDGGPGPDQIWATAGDDVFVFGLGDGADSVTDLLHDQLYLFARDWQGLQMRDPALNEAFPALRDPAALSPQHWQQWQSGLDTLRFEGDIAPADIRVENRGDALAFAHRNGSDRVVFENWFVADHNQLGRVEFSDGTLWNRDMILARLGQEHVNAPPALLVPLPTVLEAVEDQAFEFAVPAETFVDPDGDPLRLTATLAGGDPLPDWLHFDADGLTLIGTPHQADVATYTLHLVASDPSGGVAGQEVDLAVRNVNDAPAVGTLVGPQQAVVGQPWRLSLPAEAFLDEDPGEVLGYRLERVDGGALPGWLELDPASGDLAGTPPLQDLGSLDLRLSAVDQAGAQADQTFALRVDTGLTVIDGDDGRNRLSAGRTGGFLRGHGGNDRLFGGRSHDVLAGGAGDDLMAGAAGDDLYLFGRGDGQDRIVDIARRGESNRLRFDGDIAAEDLWFRRRGVDLEVSVIGTADRLRVTAWYLSENARLASFHLGDGRVLETGQVAALVDAMAAFEPPGAGETSLVPGYRQVIEPVLAAAWQ